MLSLEVGTPGYCEWSHAANLTKYFETKESGRESAAAGGGMPAPFCPATD